jgi:hypothetical protein
MRLRSFVYRCLPTVVVLSVSSQAVDAQRVTEPPSLCDLRLSIIESQGADSLHLGLAEKQGILRAPRGFRIVVATLRGSVPRDTMLTVSAAEFAAFHAGGASAGRALAFAEADGSLKWVGTLLGDQIEVNRTVRAGVFRLAVAFVVPANTSEMTISYPSKIPGQRRISD